MKVGLLGGSFDPVHVGHLMMAENAIAAAQLDEVWLLVTPDPPHKPDWPLSPYADRLAMARLAVAERPKVLACDFEQGRPGPHFTLDTVRLLREGHPDWGKPWLIVGVDSALQLHTWHRPHDLLALVDLLVIPRPGYPTEALAALETGANPLLTSAQLAFIIKAAAQAIPVEVSATDIRARVRAGESIQGLVSEPVREYIDMHALYREFPDRPGRMR